MPSYDGNGNVSILADASDGSLASEYDYSPFGQTLKATGSATNVNPFTFSTKYQDVETELFYYGFRYYNAETGTWLNRDPIEEEGGLNLYAMVQNDAVNAWDLLRLAVLVKDMKIVVKSYIMKVGSNYGSLTSVTGRSVDSKLKQFARFLDLTTSRSSAPSGDDQDGGYRLFSEKTYTVCYDDEENIIISAKLKDPTKPIIIDGGKELGIFTTAVIDGNHTGSLSGGSYDFSWRMAGRPNGAADSSVSGPSFFPFVASTFSEVRYREPSRRWIFHVVEGKFEVKNGELITEMDLSSSSKFPTHRAWVDGEQKVNVD